jgi:hypothetical protein
MAALLGASFSLIRQNKRMIGLLRDMALSGAISDRIIYVLAQKVSPRGHVDLTMEEIEQARRPEVYRHEDGTVRILAK